LANVSAANQQRPNCLAECKLDRGGVEKSGCCANKRQQFEFHRFTPRTVSTSYLLVTRWRQVSSADSLKRCIFCMPSVCISILRAYEEVSLVSFHCKDIFLKQLRRAISSIRCHVISTAVLQQQQQQQQQPRNVQQSRQRRTRNSFFRAPRFAYE
jgi:hypothetical protein